MKLKVGHWSVERKCQRGVVIQDGLPSDRWGAQRRLSCTMTVSYNADTSELADCFSQTAEIILPPQFPNDPPVLK